MMHPSKKPQPTGNFHYKVESNFEKDANYFSASEKIVVT